MTFIDIASAREAFPNALPSVRLGQEHSSLEQFRQATDFFAAEKKKEYSLVMVTEPSRKRILLGKKHRGFGEGMYNSFGGKLEPGESDVQSASRELEEETGISVAVEHMAESKLGVLRFSFEDGPLEMIVHVFRINVAVDAENTVDPRVICLDPSVIRGCDEITPIWFDNWNNVPLDNMHADDSLWLTNVLHSPDPLLVNGWFHFKAGGTATNSILHYYLDLKHDKSQTEARTSPIASESHPSFKSSS